MFIEEEISDKFKKMQASDRKHMGHAMNLEITHVSRDRMCAIMPVNQNTIQPFGILHGGASVALAETLASIGAWLNLSDENKTAVGLEINANHIRPVPEGESVIATAQPIHRGAQTQVWETRIETEAGKLVCISRCTLAIVRSKRA